MFRESEAYKKALEASKELHRGKAFTGKFLRPHAAYIGEIIKRLGCKTALDYGCGKGQQYEWVIPSTGQTIEDLWGLKVTKYDPAYPPFAKEPSGTYDIVICTQVLGAIPVGDREWVVDRLYSLASKAIYVSERLGEARKEVGDNALRGAEWVPFDWMELLGGRKTSHEVTLSTRTWLHNGEKVTSHFRTRGEPFEAWHKVEWPEGVRAMNHKWVP